MIIANNALYSIGVLSGGWYTLSSPNNEITTTNNNTFDVYDVCGNGYNLSELTGAGTTTVSTYTVSAVKYSSGVSTGDQVTTINLTVSANHVFHMSLLLNDASQPWANSARATLAVPFIVPAGTHTNTAISVDLSAADVVSDPETRRLTTLGFIG